jgi:hypothetical protein
MKEVERIKGFSFKHDNLLKVSEFTEQIPESVLQIFLSTSMFWPRYAPLLGFLNTLNGARIAPPPAHRPSALIQCK